MAVLWIDEISVLSWMTPLRKRARDVSDKKLSVTTFLAGRRGSTLRDSTASALMSKIYRKATRQGKSLK